MTFMRTWALVVGLAPAIMSCGNSGSSNAGSTGGQTASTNPGGTGGAATASGGAGPAITSAPAAWDHPTDCGGIGDTCPSGIFGCGTRSSCQLEGYVCIPALAQGATAMPSKSADHPYCAAYTCMTFEEASCFCTGAAGTSTKACASPSQLAGLCVGQGSGCATSSCCSGLACVHGIGTAMVCEQSCTSNADCSSGCCTDLRDTGDMICAAASACTNPCKKTAEACTQGSSTTPNDCCQGDCINSTNAYYSGCRRHCSKNSDCITTGCCTPYSDGSYGFCVDSLFCSCGAEGAACGQNNTSACCTGTHCVGFDSNNTYNCYKDCLVDGDCPNGCCAAVTGSDYRVCAPAADCP